MSRRMLIDAAHAEETRVVVIDGNKLEEFDFESAARTLLKGNIYLARVTRVEPSLQAAFVEYGGGRHGFLAFSEVHPDYYQIPIADRQALIERQAAEDAANGSAPEAADGDAAGGGDANGEDSAAAPVETVSGQEEEEIARRPPPAPRYRIQEVVKRRQILLVQVTKEERGAKGAALTTYISLAGRYCVLMPNTTRGGGISRKIQSAEARKRLRSVVSALNLPDGMAVILRTAGQNRTRAEIKRDYEYLLRLWEHIRQLTLESTAPAVIHEEANLIKRSIRDLYRSEIEEVLVEGDDGYRTAKAFMRTLMPSHAKRVQPYRDRVPLFTRHRVEDQLDSMHGAAVQLPSGGHIVLSPTEALVAIDVNSGRATRERGIEETATRTNLEAADEIARQLRLRDLAGLVVIDFIDMADARNTRAVERRLKEAMQSDRARIQMGRISGFGLLELSRQRLRPSLQELDSIDCPRCAGSGRVRSVESTALRALRAIEEEGVRGRAGRIRAAVPTPAALFLVNRKRAALGEIEERYGMAVSLDTEDSDGAPECRIEVLEARAEEAPDANGAAAARGGEEAPKRRSRRRARAAEPAADTEEEAAETAAEPDAAGEAEEADANGDRPRRRRRGRRGGRRQARARTRTGDSAADAAPDSEAPAPDAAPEAAAVAEAAAETVAEAPPAAPESAAAPDAMDSIVRPKRRRRARKAKADAPTAAAPDSEAQDSEAQDSEAQDSEAQDAAGAADAPDEEATADGNGEDAPERTDGGAEPVVVSDDPPAPPRRGWWLPVAGAS